MAVYKDKERGTWYFELKIKDDTGKYRKHKRRGFATKKEALASEIEFKQNYTSSGGMTLNEVFAKYDFHAQNKKAVSTIATDRQRYNKHIRNKLGDKVFLKITASQIFEWQNELANNYKNSFVNTLLTTLKTIFNFADRVLDLHNSAIKKVDKLKVSKLDSVSDTWNLEEFQHFFKCIDNQKYQVFFYTLYFTGMRRGEILALQWKDFKNNSLHIYKNYTRHGMGKPKTENSIREVALDDNNVKLLKQYKSAISKQDGFNDNYYIFGGIDPAGFTTIEKAKNKYVKLSGVKKIRLHDFRHSHVSFLIHNNVPLPLIAKRVGDTIDTILNTYAHVFEDDMSTITNLIQDCGGILGEKI